MGLTTIQGQPINVEPYTPDACNLGDRKAYCALFNVGDPLYWQGIQTPCSNQLISEGDITAPANNLVSDGDFATDPTGVWTWTGGHWTWDNVNFEMCHNTGNSTHIYQNLALTIGLTYYIEFTISGASIVSGNSFSLEWDGVTYSITASGGNPNGTFSFYYTYTGGGADFGFITGSNFDGCIDDVIVAESTFGLTGGWSLAYGSLCHSEGYTNAVTISSPFDLTTQSGFYQIGLTISGMTGGSLYVSFAGVTAETITANGTYTFFFDASGAGYSPPELLLTPDTDFDGCITDLEAYELRTDWIAQVTDLDGAVLGDISDYLQYDDNFITLAVPDTSDMFYGAESPANFVDGGCYKICISERCDREELVLNGDFTGNADNWTFASKGGPTTMSYNANRVEGDGGTTGIPYVYQDLGAFDRSRIYILSVEMGQITDSGTGKNVVVTLQSNYTGTTGAIYYQELALDYGTNTFIISPGDWIAGFGYFQPGPIGMISVGAFTNVNGNAYQDDFYIDNISLEILAYGNPYCSNCITVATEHDCAKQVEGVETGKRMGFNFDSDFRLLQRVRVLKFNPEYPLDDNTNDYSDGSSRLTYAARKKYYTAKFDYMGETEHDTLSTQIMCRDFEIDSQRYTVKLEDYKPEWDKEGGQQLAQSRLTVSKYGSNISNTSAQ